MTALERMRRWIATFPDFDILSEFQVDYTNHAMPGSGGIFPDGLVEVERREDVVGNVVVANQYNFGIFCVFAKDKDDDTGATINADWVMSFQEWVQEQSVLRLAPVFGDVPEEERISAQNGVLYDIGEGVGTYMVQLSVLFKKKFEVKNPWLT